MEKTGSGMLRIRVSSANNAIPVPEASVIVFADNDDGEGGVTLRTMLTDSSGVTDTVSVPAPAKSASLIPGEKKPYSTVNIRVTREGYYPVENVGVPIFDGVLSEQNVNLIPRDAGDFPDEGIIIIENPQSGTVYGGDD